MRYTYDARSEIKPDLNFRRTLNAAELSFLTTIIHTWSILVWQLMRYTVYLAKLFGISCRWKRNRDQEKKKRIYFISLPMCVSSWNLVTVRNCFHFSIKYERESERRIIVKNHCKELLSQSS